MPNWKIEHRLLLFSLVILSGIGYFLIGYQIERSQHVSLLALYTGLFIVFSLLVTQYREHFKLLGVIAIGLRLIFILAIPNLSQDFYRFIWDGRLILAGFSPYLYTPISLLEGVNIPFWQANELVQHMGSLSAGNLSNYPPLNQFCFVLAALLSGKSILGSVVVMRVLTILSDVGILVIGRKLLTRLKLPSYHIFWYILNPLVIIELTGNLHFESVMLFFVLMALYLIQTNRWKLSAVSIAMAISVKLIPLMFLPLFFKQLGLKRWISYCCLVGLVSVVLFLPFLSSDLLKNYAETTGLWFQKFEFNASIYYLFRELGFLVRGYNEIAFIGVVLSLMVMLFALYRSFDKTNSQMTGLLGSMLIVSSIYFFSATTVHPWYLASPLLFSVFTRFHYVRIWTYTIILSYLAYINLDANENSLVLLLEYLPVYGWFIYELRNKPASYDQDLVK